MTEDYKYFAFLSFQSADAKEALRMQRALETYRLPYAVSRRHSLPRKLGQCFCYLSDISLREELMHELEARLAESRYLIVLCSPQSAKSTFVNGGIERFISLGRRDRIIPLIVDGIPYSGDPETECYPEALRRHFPKSSNPFEDHQILGVNIHEEGVSARRARQRAVVMVMARMLGLNFEDLWRREVKRRRQRTAMSIMALAMILSAIGLTWQMSKSFNMAVSIEENTPQNTYLPQSDSVAVTFTLQGDVRQEMVVDRQGMLHHLPSSVRNQRIQVQAICLGFLPLDTMVEASSSVCLTLTRDSHLYGHLTAVVWREQPLPNIELQVANHTVITDEQGRFALDLPIEEQRKAYPVVYQGQLLDSLYAPCGKNDVIVIP